jgi:hypothetical protein
MGKKKKDKRKWPGRIPTPPPTRWDKDKSKYNRKKKHRKGEEDE